MSLQHISLISLQNILVISRRDILFISTFYLLVRRCTLHLGDGAVLLLLTPLRSAKSHARVLEAVERQAKFFTSCQIHLMQHVLTKLSFGEPPKPVPCPLAVSAHMGKEKRSVSIKRGVG